MTTQDTTIRTSAADALTDWQQARAEVQRAGVAHANQQTRATKIALEKARAEETRLLKEYHQARLIQLAAVTEKQKRNR